MHAGHNRGRAARLDCVKTVLILPDRLARPTPDPKAVGDQVGKDWPSRPNAAPTLSDIRWRASLFGVRICGGFQLESRLAEPRTNLSRTGDRGNSKFSGGIYCRPSPD
jgi:hypothetical protein